MAATSSSFFSLPTFQVKPQLVHIHYSKSDFEKKWFVVEILENDDGGEENYTLFYGYTAIEILFFTILSLLSLLIKDEKKKKFIMKRNSFANSLRIYIYAEYTQLPVDISLVQLSS